MNLFHAHSLPAKAECATILNTVENFMSSQDSKPLLVFKQDVMSGAYKLTYGRIEIKRHIFYDCLMQDFNLSDAQKSNWIEQKSRHIIKVYKSIQNEFHDFNKIKNEVHSSLINNQSKLIKRFNQSNSDFVKNELDLVNKHLQNFDEYMDNYILFTGHSIISFLLPNNFNYYHQNNLSPDKKPIVIKAGVLLSGTLNKTAIGNTNGSIIHHLCKDFGNKFACDFMSYFSKLINHWLIHFGITISISDCIPNNTNIIESEMNKSFLDTYSIILSEKDPDQLEDKIQTKLNEATNIGQKLAKESFNEFNNFIDIVNSGAKGSYFNITQVTGTIGQQNVNGTRIKSLFNGRSLPHYSKELFNTNFFKQTDFGNDPLPYLKQSFEAKGFISNSYYKGMTPQEYFFSAAGGREGLIDTAIKSVTFDTLILIIENTGFGTRGDSKVVQIGEWIDSLIENDLKLGDQTNVTFHPNNMQYLDLKKEVYIPTGDYDGKCSWQLLSAITRHDPGEFVYEIQT